MDVLLDPVSEAAAAPPDVATEQCNKTVMYKGGTWIYAEHAYPGKLKNDLAPVHAVAHLVNNAVPMPPGYQDFATTPVVRDGFAAVFCGTQGNASADTVTFVLP